MTIIKEQRFGEERALYASEDLLISDCRFEGEEDGESALKESKRISACSSLFDLRYPFWHDSALSIKHCVMTEKCRAALWYSEGIEILNTKLHGTKALRECSNVTIDASDIKSDEFGWFVHGLRMKDTSVLGGYFMLRSDDLNFKNVTLDGKYSFQYIENSRIEDCSFKTKDAFWHAKNTVIKNSVISGEYLAWYSEDLTFENCRISGTQPFCYCKNLKLINCELADADLAFERSSVDADITTHLISIKNPTSGRISAPSIGEIIDLDKNSACEILIGKNE